MMDVGLIYTLGLSPQDPGCRAGDDRRTHVWAVVGRSLWPFLHILSNYVQSPKCLASE